MSGCVTVTGPPAAICFWKIGTTLPEEPRTLPKRTATKRVGSGQWAVGSEDGFNCRLPTADCPLFNDWIYNSANRLVAPITLVGLTALSVETMTKAAAPLAKAASATVLVPK